MFFLYLLLAVGGALAGKYAVQKMTGRTIPLIPGTTPGGGGTQSSTKLQASSDDAHGIDVSSAQGVIDWDKVAASGMVQFCIIKTTEGASGVDGKAAFNYAGAGTHGIKKLAYHFAHYGSPNAILDPRQQAQFFCQKIKEFGGIDGPPTLDFELVDSKTNLSPLSPAATCQWAVDFIDEMHKQGYPEVWLYSYPSYLLQLGKALADSGLAAMCKLWIADYGQTVNQSGDVADGATPMIWTNKQYASVGALWPTWVCWQTHGNDNLPKGTGSPRIPGIGDAVDRNRFNGTLKQMSGGLLA